MAEELRVLTVTYIVRDGGNIALLADPYDGDMWDELVALFARYGLKIDGGSDCPAEEDGDR